MAYDRNNPMPMELVAGGAPLGFTPSVASAGLTRTRVTAAATVNETAVKTAAGNLYRATLKNRAAYEVFAKFYDKAGTVGAAPINAAVDVPVFVIPIAAGEGYDGYFPDGEFFANGVRMTITKLIADTDTTVLVANDVLGWLTSK